MPARAVRAGKVASAFFLEQVGAKGMQRGIEIAPYHANLIYNLGNGTAAQIRELVVELNPVCGNASGSKWRRRCSTSDDAWRVTR